MSTTADHDVDGSGETKMEPITVHPSHARLEGETQPRPSLDLEAIATQATQEAKWSYNSWLHEFEDQKVADDIKKKHLALTWRNLVVTGLDSQTAFGDNVPSFFNPVELLRSSRNHSTRVCVVLSLRTTSD